MRYYGEIGDTQGRVTSVEIVTGGDSGRTVRLDDGSAGIWFASEEALVITGETNDVMDVLVRRSAVIRLETRDYIRDLFRADCREATVRVVREGEVLFRGFVLPRTYSQAYNSVLDTLEVNCVDRLGALQWQRWDVARTGRMSLWDVVSECLRMVDGDVSAQSVRVASDYLMEPGGVGALYGCGVDCGLFCGEAGDDESRWTLEDVVKECLQFLNLHIMELGDGYLIFSWDDLKAGERLEIAGAHGGGASPDRERVGAYGEDGTLEIGEIFNRYTVVCDLGEMDDAVRDPLDADEATSPYRRRTLYMTEWDVELAKGKDGKVDLNECYDDVRIFLYKVWGSMQLNQPSDRVWRRDWWVRVMENRGWRFYCAGDDGVRRDFYAGRTDGGVWENRVPDDVVQQRGAAILEISTARTDFKVGDNGVETDMTKSRVMVVGVNGTGAPFNGVTGVTGSEAVKMNRLNGLFRASAPRAVYEDAGGVFSPSDYGTTRYLDISGKIVLAPFMASPSWGDFHRAFPLPDYDSTLGIMGIASNCQVQMGEDKLRVMQRLYRAYEHPDPWPVETGVPADCVANGGGSGSGLDLFAEGESPQSWKMNGTVINGQHYAQDGIGFVPVLRCMMIVGDKCVRQRVGTVGDPDDFYWDYFREREDCADDDEFYRQSFSIGFDPKVGDLLVGARHDIRKNAGYPLLLDDAGGTVIPVRREDNVSGAVRFMILGPENELWGERPMYHHDEWCEGDRVSVPAGYYCMMDSVSAVWLEDFCVKVISDNGKDDPLEDSEIVYTSDTEESFENEHDDVDFRICSALTASERADFGVRDVMGRAVVTDLRTGAGVTSLYDPRTEASAKAEQLFVDWHYREGSRMRVELEQGVMDPGGDLMLRTWLHPARRDMVFYALRCDRDIQAGSARLRLREI